MSLQQNERDIWVFGILWGFELFSHGNHHIRVFMHHVCLIQSISARTAIHIKLGTCSGSSQCQLHFGTKMVLIGWSGCEWLPFECRNAHFQAFPPLTPSGFLWCLYLPVKLKPLVQQQLSWENFFTPLQLPGRNKQDETPLIVASDNGFLDCVQELLLQDGIDIDAQAKRGRTHRWTALHCACQ